MDPKRFKPKNSAPDMDPYRVLGVDRQATDAEIKRAYFQGVRRYPPEKDPEKFREIRTAYEHLRDPKKRAMVDLFLLQPPPPMPNRRRPKYDLSVHQEDLIALAVDILSMPMEEDFQGA
jgi:curved DNA-binding protein CbpA